MKTPIQQARPAMILAGRQRLIVMKQEPKIKRPIFSQGNTLVEDYRKAVQWAYDMGLIRKPLSASLLRHDPADKKPDGKSDDSDDQHSNVIVQEP